MLENVLEIIKRDGWTQNMFVNPQGQHCLLGAVMSAAGVNNEAMLTTNASDIFGKTRLKDANVVDAVNAIANAIRLASRDLDSPHNCDEAVVVGWNDGRARNKWEVIAMLNLAIRMEKQNRPAPAQQNPGVEPTGDAKPHFLKLEGSA